jgi:hypothetical protein
MRCRHCQYDLSGVLLERPGAEAVCPECGAAAVFSTDVPARPRRIAPAMAFAFAPHVVAVLVLTLDHGDYGLPRNPIAVLVVLACWGAGFFGGIAAAHRLLTRSRETSQARRTLAVLTGAPLAVGMIVVSVLLGDLLSLLVGGV